MNFISIFIAMGFAALLGASGQLFLKIGSSKETIMQMVPWFAGFAALYGVAVIINILVYRAGAKVTIAYPIISLSYVFAALLAWKFLGEPLSGYQLTGTLIIMAGISVLSYGAQI